MNAASTFATKPCGSGGTGSIRRFLQKFENARFIVIRTQISKTFDEAYG